MIYNPDSPAGALFVRWFESTAGLLGFKPTIAHIHGLADIERAVAAAAAQQRNRSSMRFWGEIACEKAPDKGQPAHTS